MIRTLSLLLAAAFLTGCFLAPGMRMNESALEERGKGAADPSRFRVVPITPQVLTAQAKARDQTSGAAATSTRPLQPDAPTAYRIAPNDVLSVIVWEHPELTIPAGEFRAADTTGYPVSADGRIFFPHVGLVEAAGRTTEELRLTLTERLGQYVQKPQLQVLVAAYRGRRAQVAGEVLQPSPVPITDVPLRVQDAIALARGFTPEADLGHVMLIRGAEQHQLDLGALYERGDLSQNWILQEGDLVHVPDRSRNKIFVMGEVRKPAAKLMVKGRMTLAEALGDSEGFDPTAANPAQILVFRGQYEAPDVYRLDASSPDALLLATQFQLQPRDVVFVATYDLTRFNRVVAQILPSIQLLWQTYAVIRSF